MGLLVRLVAAGPVQHHFEQRQAQRGGLRQQHLALHAVHGDALVVAIDRGEQADHLPLRIGQQALQCHQAVLAAAPGQQYRGAHAFLMLRVFELNKIARPNLGASSAVAQASG